MVFCCIAIVGVAIAYWAFLSLRQLFSGPQRDPASELPTPPRALTGNASQPVFGHTGLFARFGGDIALKFPPHWKEWGYWLPSCCSRDIGDCFSIFIWGQWRVVIKGPERCRKILESPDLIDDWAWNPPVSLLGKSVLLEGEEEEFMRSLLQVPLSQKNVQKHAPEFARIAERYVDEMLNSDQQQMLSSNDKPKKSPSSSRSVSSGSSSDNGDGDDDDHGKSSQTSGGQPPSYQVKWKALRSYTLDLVDGPLFGMNRLQPGERKPGSSSKLPSSESNDARKNNKPQSSSTVDGDETDVDDEKVQRRRSNLLLWMERLKRALCVIKITMGPEWMYMWLLSEYGRAVNARMHLTKVITKHVNSRVEAGNVEHKVGHVVQDPLSMPIPIWALAERVFYRNENVVGEEGIPRQRQKRRSLSEGYVAEAEELNRLYARDYNDDDDYDHEDYESLSSSSEDEIDEENEQPAFTKLQTIPEPDTLVNDSSMHSRRTLATGRVVQEGDESVTFVFQHQEPPPTTTTNRIRANSEPIAFHTLNPKVTPRDDSIKQNVIPKPNRTTAASAPTTVLDLLLRQQDSNGTGLTQAVTTEVCILLWMMMDAGNAWTSMALKLLSLDYEACHRVQLELDQLVAMHGKEKLFTPAVMKKMVTLDALLYEAIRLCPSFLGGMKKTTHTVELEDCMLQIPKNTHVIFCQPSSHGFDLSKAMGKRPERLGKAYPCPELHGFLPYKGLEVPLMVLQSKVFLAVLLRRYSPHMSKKRTFVRKLKERFRRDSQLANGDYVAPSATDPASPKDTSDQFARFEDEHSSSHHQRQPMNDVSFSSVQAESTDDNDNPYLSVPSSFGLGKVDGVAHTKITSQSNCMHLFDKIPFPEPRRVINVRERESALELLGGVGAGIANVV